MGYISLGIMNMLFRLSNALMKATFIVAMFGVVPTADAACNIINDKVHGDCAGVAIHRGTRDPLRITGTSSENGIVSGAMVFSGGSLYLSGISNGDITVHKGGRLLLTGVVNGTVRNLGGTVEIEGTVDHLFTTSGEVTVGGVVGGVSGPGTVAFRRGSVLGDTPFEDATRRSGKT